MRERASSLPGSRVIALATLTVSLAAASSAAAQPKGQTEGQRLFEEARVLASSNRWSEACPLLAESQRLEPNGTTEFRLADCSERIGKIASAWKHYVGAARTAAQTGDTAKQRFAEERAAKLEPRVDKLLLLVGDAPPTLQIERDGRPVPREEWNVPQPLDPGEHTVHAWAPAKESFDAVFTLKGNGELRRIEVPPLDPARPWPRVEGGKTNPIVEVTTPPPPPDAPTPRAPPPAASTSGWRPLGWVLGGIGIGAVAVGGVLFVDQATRTNPCSGSSCLPSVTIIGIGSLVILGGALVLVSTSN